MASYSNPFYNWNDTYTYTDDGKIKRIDSESNDKKISGIPYMNIMTIPQV